MCVRAGRTSKEQDHGPRAEQERHAARLRARSTTKKEWGQRAIGREKERREGGSEKRIGKVGLGCKLFRKRLARRAVLCVKAGKHESSEVSRQVETKMPPSPRSYVGATRWAKGGMNLIFVLPASSPE